MLPLTYLFQFVPFRTFSMMPCFITVHVHVMFAMFSMPAGLWRYKCIVTQTDRQRQGERQRESVSEYFNPRSLLSNLKTYRQAEVETPRKTERQRDRDTVTGERETE